MSQATLQARTGRADVAVTPMAVARTDIAVIPTVTGSQLVVQHPLLLDERMVALACAISIDYNFFSKHSQTGEARAKGWPMAGSKQVWLVQLRRHHACGDQA